MRITLLFAAVALFFIAGCKKSEEFINPVYECNCGTVKWRNADYPLLMAKYVESIPGDNFSRRYYLTADIRQEGETLPHNLNIQIGIDSLTSPSFYIPENDVFTLFEEVNDNDEMTPIRTYAATTGFVNVGGAIIGGEESVNYQMVLKEVVNGQQVGFDISAAGEFEITIE